MQVAQSGVLDRWVLQIGSETELSVTDHIERAAKLVPVSATTDEFVLLSSSVDSVANLIFESRDVHDETPNVRAKLPAEAGAVSLVRDDAPCAADQAYGACRSGSA
jgi:hypothetical protein